ncbi:universal stress protein [Sinorhizobium sp. BG8]|uniref:universal stress protein n=1 Tax=Sinorhizobium sp. BG8 TaxID=2613773 RepID=UPI00193DB8B6|nr:universal stress protein [Sinorhizobium sp. BG8]QRM55246.1 universal stress protein [Sinorhizobium sp. BG8]
MPYKTVLSVSGVGDPDDDLRSAIELCAAEGAHLSALIMALAAPPPIGEYAAAVSEAWLEERERDMSALGDRRVRAQNLLNNSGISYELAEIYTEAAWVSDEVGTRARYADVVLVGGALSAERNLRKGAVDGGLFNSPCPVLMVPKGCRATLSPRRILLAWNSGLEAAHAAREAIGMMAGAEMVHVTMIDPRASEIGQGEEPGADIAAHLARHGITVTVDRLSGGGRTVSAVLNAHARDIAADLIVMGGYGHSRLREQIFGGVTREMLDTAQVPLLMVH